MIILIKTDCVCRKSQLAEKIISEYKYQYVSMNVVKMSLVRSDNIDLELSDSAEMTKYLWPIITKIIVSGIENKENLIVEGCYIPDNWHNDFSKNYLNNILFGNDGDRKFIKRVSEAI